MDENEIIYQAKYIRSKHKLKFINEFQKKKCLKINKIPSLSLGMFTLLMNIVDSLYDEEIEFLIKYCEEKLK